jgi:hypothetical protein
VRADGTRVEFHGRPEALTDAEIDEVYISAVGPGEHWLADVEVMHACKVARNTHGDFTDKEQAAARIIVVATINARAKAKAGR